MSIKLFVFSMVGLLLSFGSNAQQIIKAQFRNEATIWQGMNHRWDEGNHRYSRCGSIVESYPNQKDSIRHSGASGSLRDILYFNTRYTTIQTPSIAFFTGVKEMEFKKVHTDRTKSIEFVDSIQLELPDVINGVPIHQIDPQQISIALNGFDMVSLKRGLPVKIRYKIEQSFFKNGNMIAIKEPLEAYDSLIHQLQKEINSTITQRTVNNGILTKTRVDKRHGETSKLFKFDLYLDNLKFDPINNSLSFKVIVDFGMNCKSIECNRNTSRRIIRYLLRVGYLVMIHDKDKVSTLTDSTNYEYSWDDKKEIFYKDSTIKQTITLGTESTFQAIVPMFKQISVCTYHHKKINQPKAFHLQELSFLLNSSQEYHSTPPYYKDYLLSTDLFYKTWSRGNHIFSFKSKGNVSLKCTTLLLLINRDAIVNYTTRNFEGIIDFKTDHLNQTTPSNAAASKVISAY